MRNWVIKQIFYIRYFFKLFEYKKIGKLQTFSSSGFHDGQWTRDHVGWYMTNSFKQKYGIFKFIAVMDGSFETNLHPALWMLNNKDVYFEIDIEIMTNKNIPYLVYTVWMNPHDNIPSNGKVVRLNYNKHCFINDLRTKPLEYIIKWNEKEVRFYILGLLTGIVKMSPTQEMWLAAGNVNLLSAKVFK